ASAGGVLPTQLPLFQAGAADSGKRSGNEGTVASGGTPIVISSALDTDAGERSHLAPAARPSDLKVTQHLRTLEGAMAAVHQTRECSMCTSVCCISSRVLPGMVQLGMGPAVDVLHSMAGLTMGCHGSNARAGHS
ncbi:UNVERIFIED_CONTAM: hypothetical protein K2H54_049337, partial [Gekko kuhli]